MERLYDDAKTREADLIQLAEIASTYPNRERFPTELTLDPPTASGGEAGVPLLDEDYLVLSTIHSAKGQEWNSVFVLNCVDGCIPSDLATKSTPEIEEERRLLYVAMTRAKDHLHLIVPQRFYAYQQRNNGDRHMYALRTRFIPDAITDRFEQCAWPTLTRESSSNSSPSKDCPYRCTAEANVALITFGKMVFSDVRFLQSSCVGVLQWVDDDSPIGCGKLAVHQTAGLGKTSCFQ